MSHRRRTWVDENAKMGRIWDQVQDQMQEVWDRGHRVQITGEAVHCTVLGDSGDLESPKEQRTLQTRMAMAWRGKESGSKSNRE